MLTESNITKRIEEDGKKELSIYHYPPCYFSLGKAVLESILLSTPLAFEWYYSTQIQMFFIPDEAKRISRSHLIGFYPDLVNTYNSDKPYALFLDNVIIDETVMELKRIDIVNDMIRWINNDYYIVCQANVGYIPGACYFGESRRHTLFAFAYDLHNNSFKTLDFDETGKFKIIAVNFKDFARALTECENRYEIALYRLNPNAKFPLSVPLIKEQLSDYLNGIDTGKKYSLFYTQKDYIYGVNVYRELLNYIDKIDRGIDYRAFHALWEHKKLMTSRIKYLEEKNVIIPQKELSSKYVKIEQKAETLKNLIIKYSISRDVKTIEGIKESIHDIHINEKSVLNELIACM